jgi:hypothetical protein
MLSGKWDYDNDYIRGPGPEVRYGANTLPVSYANKRVFDNEPGFEAPAGYTKQYVDYAALLQALKFDLNSPAAEEFKRGSLAADNYVAPAAAAFNYGYTAPAAAYNYGYNPAAFAYGARRYKGVW